MVAQPLGSMNVDMGKLVEEQDAPRVRHTLLEEGIVDITPRTASADFRFAGRGKSWVCWVVVLVTSTEFQCFLSKQFA